MTEPKRSGVNASRWSLADFKGFEHDHATLAAALMDARGEYPETMTVTFVPEKNAIARHEGRRVNGFCSCGNEETGFFHGLTSDIPEWMEEHNKEHTL